MDNSEFVLSGENSQNKNFWEKVSAARNGTSVCLSYGSK